MNPSTTASVICPACGQPFLCMQQNPEGVAQCPHCAHSGLRAHFGTQIQVMGIAPGRRQVAQTQPMAAPVWQPPPPPVQPQQTWQPTPPVTSPARMTLQHSQALMPTFEPPPPVEAFVPAPQTQGTSGSHVLLMLVFMVVCGVGVWWWWDHANTPLAISKSTAPETIIAPVPGLPVPTAAPKVIAPRIELPDMALYAADAKTLVSELFTADTPERRMASVHEGGGHQAEIEALVGPAAAEKVELRLLGRMAGVPYTLPGGQPMPLFKLVTSKCPNGALVRLETGADGRRRLSWPLLYETHQGKLAEFLKQGSAEDAAWFHVGMRPSHGLDIPAELRPKFLTFDVQTSATSDPHFVACVERDSPLGRFMDRESEWGRVYLARLLVRRLEVQGDAPCMVVLDCEGAKER